MKLTEQDKQDACEYIMDEACKACYGLDYKEKGIHFRLDQTPFTVRESIDLFIEWLKIRAQEQKGEVKK